MQKVQGGIGRQKMAMDDINRLMGKNEERKKKLAPFMGLGKAARGGNFTSAAIAAARKFLGR